MTVVCIVILLIMLFVLHKTNYGDLCLWWDPTGMQRGLPA